MTFDIHAGSDHAAYAQRIAVEALLLWGGRAERFIPLNGGSDTRRDAREFQEQMAAADGLPFFGCGSLVRVGGAHRRGRGRRYVRSTDGGTVTLRWIDWRKAKRLVRKRRCTIIRP